MPVVREGQEVARGQLIAEPDGFMSVAMHAPASGVVQRIGLAPGISGRMAPAFSSSPSPAPARKSARATLRRWTRRRPMTSSGDPAGGHCRPGRRGVSHPCQTEDPADKPIDTLIINGVECEPYLTTDHRVMLEQQADIFSGIRYLLKVTGAERAIIGVEANKLDVADALRPSCPLICRSRSRWWR